MSREDIGSYLGLKLETVSRTLSRLTGAGLIAVQARHVRILDKGALADISKGRAPIPPACVVPLPQLAA
ncbi:Fumarate and nitrate reduction regulatory protein [compost metagenome]